MARVAETHRHLPAGQVAVGRIVGAWGIWGQVKVEALTDFPKRFEPGSRLLLKSHPIIIEAAHFRGTQGVVRLSGIKTRNEAHELRELLLTIPQNEISPLPTGQLYRFQFVGLEVWTDDETFLGTITDIMETGSNDVLLVHRPENGREITLPLIDEVIKEIDLDGGKVRINLLPGLLK